MTTHGRWLPSKQFSLVLTSIIIVGILIGLAYWYEPKNSESADTARESDSRERAVVETRDTDGDGLYDWEENLWQTDIHNTDSDGDGTPDGQEVAENRDPTIAGPNDDVTVDISSDTTTDISELSHSDIVVNTLVSRYLTARNAGVPLDATQANSLVATLLEEGPVIPEAEQYTTSDLEIQNDANREAIRAYGNTLGTLFAKRPDELSNELVVFALFGQSGELQELESLETVSESYKEIVDGLLSVPVPSLFISIHVALTNSLSSTASRLASMADYADDPLALLIILSEYRASSDAFVSLFRTLRNQFRSTGVIFSPEESGFIITNEQELEV